MNYKTGQFQVTLGIGMALVTFVASPVVAFYGSRLAIQDDISKISERTAKLETLQPVTQDDIKEIKEDLKAIRQALNIKP